MITIDQKHLDGDSYLREMMAQGRYTFTLEEATRALKVSKVAARAVLRRLKNKALVVMPARGFYVIVSPEYVRLGCLPADQFITELMAYLGAPYYVGLLSAAELHGAAHQKPQEFQVITSRNRRMITCGRVKIRFVASKMIDKVPTIKITNARGFVTVSTPEATIFDLFLYPDHVGGLSNAATILSELYVKLELAQLKKMIASVPNVACLQRAGYVFDRVLKKKDAAAVLEKVVGRRAKALIPLEASGSRKGVKIDTKWKVFVNEQVEPDV